LWYEILRLHRFSGYPDFIVLILFLPESTEGVAAGQTTAMDYENAADSTENDAETVTK